jgi:hypothetical protein
MTENKINNLLVKLSKKQLEKVLSDLPTVPFDMNENMRTRRVPKPNSKTRIVTYIRYHWLDSEINETLKSLKLPFLKEQTAVDDLTKNEIKRRWRILLEREIYRPKFDEIEREFQAKHSTPVGYSPLELYLCGTKQWQQHLERTDREEQKQMEERRDFWSKKWVELGLIKG